MSKIDNNIKDENSNENRISFKLSLRKKKIKEKIDNNRINHINFFSEEFEHNKIEKYLCTDKDILSGKLYDDLTTFYKNKNEVCLRNVLNGIGFFLDEKLKNNLNIKDIILKANSSYNINNNIKNEYFPLGNLLLKIGIETDDKIVYFYCINFLLFFSNFLDNFCKEITNEKNLNDIFNKLIKFYPFLSENKNNENYKKIFEINYNIKPDVVEAYKFGTETLKFLGNIFISCENYDSFESINFYEKIFYLFFVFNLDYENLEFLNCRMNYLDTLVWLIHLILNNINNIEINYKEKILNILPCILNNINILNSSKKFDIINNLIEILEIISDFNSEFCQKIVELNGINILLNLVNALFKKNYNDDNYEDDTIEIIIDRIIYIIINIFLIDYKYLKNIDFSNFITTFENLFNYFKLNHSENKEIEIKLVHLLSTLACNNDIEPIIKYILTNKNIINNLFQKYCDYDKYETLLFIDNIMIKQNIEVKHIILNLGAFDFLKNYIYNYNENDTENLKLCIHSIYKIIESEQEINRTLFLEKLYTTSIPDKIKELFNNNKIKNENETLFKLLINELDNYEKTI